MDKLKNVLSSSSRKDDDATQAGDAHSSPTSNLTGEGSHIGSSRQPQSGGTGEHHPIYDQFASNSPSRTTGQSSNPTSLSQNPPDSAKGFGPSATQPTQSSSLRPDTGHGRPGYGGDEISTASIKSGVLGFPQGGDHAALSHHPDLDATQAQSGTGLPDRTATSEQPGSSRYGRDAALGAGAAGTGAAAGHELHRQRDRDDVRADPTMEQSAGTDFAQSSGNTRQRADEPNVTTDTDRSFPLAGSVTSRRHADEPSTTHDTSHTPITSAREPGTHEKDVGTSDGHGREGLAGAAAAAAYSSTHSGKDHKYAEPQSTRQGAGLVATSPEELRKEHELRSGHHHESKGALAGATAAASSVPHGQSQSQRELDARGATAMTQPSVTREMPQVGQSPESRSHNPEALAAAGAAASTLPHGTHQHQREHDPRSATTSDYAAAPELQNVGNTQQSGSHNPEALAGATAAASFIPREKLFGHDHGGRGHNYVGDPCETTDEKPSSGGPMYLDGPHMTDTANAMDPHLHVPGEFPETPAENPGMGTTGGYMHGSSDRGMSSNQRDDPSLTTPRTGGTASAQVPQSEDQHHYGRDAAIAGGVGAAGLGAYGAGKHHQRETTDVGNDTALPTEASPYSSSKLDPRVHGKSSALEQQRFDPTTRTEPATHDSHDQHHGRDGALGAGALGATGLAGHEASKPRDQTQSGSAWGSTQSQPPPPVFGSQNEPRAQTQPEHHYGRDAGLAGAGAAAAGGAYYAVQRGDKPDSGPASSTIGPHSSNVANVLDPRVQPDPALQKQRETGSTYEDPASRTIGPHSSNVANVVDPRVQPDPSKQEQLTTGGPHQSDTLNRLDPKASERTQPEDKHHYGRDAAVVGGTGAAGYGAYEAAKGYDQHRSTQPSASMKEQRYDPAATGAHDPATSQHHYGRDAAIAGGAGATGAGLMAHERNQPATSQQPRGYENEQPGAQQRYDPQQVQDPSQHHDKRNAAAAAGLGAAAGAGGAYAYSNQQEKEAEKERLAQQKAHDKELEHQRKEQQKELEKKQKEDQKAYEHKQKELEKEHAKEEKHHAKVAAAQEKAHEKEVEKEQAKRQHEVEKEQERQRKLAEAEELKRREAAERQHPEEEEEGKKKHGLFGFLHRNKDKKDKETSAETSPRQSREYATTGAAAGAAAGGAAAYEGSEHGSHHERNKLHKDPPPGHPAREAMEHQQHIGTDGPIGRAGEISGDHETRAGVYGAHAPGDQKQTVVEPHTGLPMNVEKYGDGHGGTDGSSNIHGAHNVEGSGQGTNWEAIRKANTPY